MAARGPVEVYGLDEFARGARELTGHIEHGATDALGPVADLVATLVRGRVPHDRGRLASTVAVRREGTRVAVQMGGGAAPYAGWIDYGGTRGRPYVDRGRYLHPAAESAESRAEQASEDAAKSEIRSMRWPRPNKY